MRERFNRTLWLICVSSALAFSVLAQSGCSKVKPKADTTDDDSDDDSTDADADSDSDSDSDSDGDSDGDADADSDGDADADTDGDADAYTDADADADTDADADADSDADADADTDADSDADADADADADSDTAQDIDTDTPADSDSDTEPVFSVPIPRDCETAAQSTTSVGCLFYAVDLIRYEAPDSDRQSGVALSNVHETEAANVKVYSGDAETGEWDVIFEDDIAPMSLKVVELEDRTLQYTGITLKGAFKIASSVPIIAYQFNPQDVSKWSADASLLLPVTSLSLTYDVAGALLQGSNAEQDFVVVATKDGTEVTVAPTATPVEGLVERPGADAPEVIYPSEKKPFTVFLDDGDVLRVATYKTNEGDIQNCTGTRVSANAGHPILLFVEDQYASIPPGAGPIEQMEEQIPGLRFWGKTFVGSRLPIRGVGDDNTTDSVYWQVYAAEDDTQITLRASSDVIGLPFETTTLQRGEAVEFMVGGTAENPGDFFIEASKPIAVNEYMTSYTNPNTNDLGDPCQVYVIPVEQYLSRYVVLVPDALSFNWIVVTRPSAQAVLVDGVTVDDTLFDDVSDAGYQVARIAVAPGIHTVESTKEWEGVNVIVAGYDNGSGSYAYPGGMGIRVTNILLE